MLTTYTIKEFIHEQTICICNLIQISLTNFFWVRELGAVCNENDAQLIYRVYLYDQTKSFIDVNFFHSALDSGEESVPPIFKCVIVLFNAKKAKISHFMCLCL